MSQHAGGLVQNTVPDEPVVAIRRQHDEQSVVGSEEGCRNEWRTQTFGPDPNNISRARGESLQGRGFHDGLLGLYDRARNALYSSEGRHIKTFEVLVVSSMTGALAWVASYPFDTVKTIVQADRTVSTAEAASRLYRLSGVKGFFRGAGASTFRAMLVTSSRMVAYEMTLQLLAAI